MNLCPLFDYSFAVFVKICWVMVDAGWCLPAVYLLFSPVIVLLVEFPEFLPEMG